jgi:DNA-binding response OmpR family regulator
MTEPMTDRLLIVEDNPLIAAAIEKAGARLQMEADVVTDGWAAIEMLREGNYRAIVIDSEIPRRSGFGVLTYLKEEVGECLGNVVVMTTSDHDSIRRRVSDRLQVIAQCDEIDTITAAVTSAVRDRA